MSTIIDGLDESAKKWGGKRIKADWPTWVFTELAQARGFSDCVRLGGPVRGKYVDLNCFPGLVVVCVRVMEMGIEVSDLSGRSDDGAVPVVLPVGPVVGPALVACRCGHGVEDHTGDRCGAEGCDCGSWCPSGAAFAYAVLGDVVGTETVSAAIAKIVPESREDYERRMSARMGYMSVAAWHEAGYRSVACDCDYERCTGWTIWREDEEVSCDVVGPDVLGLELGDLVLGG